MVLALPQSVIMLFAGLLGLVFGSFGNVLIARLPEGDSITGRSHCLRCKRVIRVHELIPVVSFLLLRGRCAGCENRIPLRYPLVEIAGALIFLLAFSLYPVDLLAALLLAVALWLLLVISVIDLRTMLIPDVLNILLVVVSVAFAFARGHVDIIAPIICAGFFALQWLVSRGKWVGSGDILLGAGVGLLAGSWIHAVMMLFAAYIIGALVASYLLLTKKVTRNAHIPFGPFLAAGCVVTLLWGDGVLGLLLRI